MLILKLQVLEAGISPSHTWEPMEILSLYIALCHQVTPRTELAYVSGTLIFVAAKQETPPDHMVLVARRAMPAGPTVL